MLRLHVKIPEIFFKILEEGKNVGESTDGGTQQKLSTFNQAWFGSSGTLHTFDT